MGRAPTELKSVFPLGKSPVLVVDPDPAAPEEQPRVVTAVFLSSANLLDKSRTHQNIFFVYKIKYKSNIPVCPRLFLTTMPFRIPLYRVFQIYVALYYG
jgi:hypothetical protein